MPAPRKLPEWFADPNKAPEEWLRQINAGLEALDSARFPGDFGQFTAAIVTQLREHTASGRRIHDRLPKQFPSDCANLIFLLALKAERAMRDARQWREFQAGLRPAEWEAAMREPVPSKEAALLAEAQRKRSAVVEERTNPLSAYHAFASQWKRQPQKPTKAERQKEASRKQDATPPRPTICDWSQPMSVTDYVRATARNRKTISGWLDDFKARPHQKRKHAADADRYGPKVSLKILARWIERWPDAAQATDLAAETAAFALVKNPDFAVRVFNAVGPALVARGQQVDADFGRSFGRALRFYGYTPPSDSAA